jgi:hypothetical protein
MVLKPPNFITNDLDQAQNEKAIGYYTNGFFE